MPTKSGTSAPHVLKSQTDCTPTIQNTTMATSTPRVKSGNRLIYDLARKLELLPKKAPKLIDGILSRSFVRGSELSGPLARLVWGEAGGGVLSSVATLSL